MKLNLGCGNTKLEGYLNIDVDQSVEPDQIFDFTQRFPFSDSSIDEVVCYHTLEHITKWKHDNIFSEVYRVLVPKGQFIITFPEFLECVERWKLNYQGQRDFWEATLYGRQASPHDHHVCIMDRELVCRTLINHGFEISYKGPEPIETFNSIIKAVKDEKFTYEDALKISIGL